MGYTYEQFIKLRELFDYFDTFEDFKKECGLLLGRNVNEDDLRDIFESSKDDDLWDLLTYNAASDSLIIKGNTLSEIVKQINDNDLANYNRIILELDNKDYDDLEKLKELNIEILIHINRTASFCSIDEFLKMREFFNTFMDTYHPEELSPLEKVTLAYDYVKFYEYHEYTEKSYDSRNIARVVSSGKIVCIGYTNLFCELLKQMNIEAGILVVTEDGEDEHVRPVVNIYDKKYNVNGLYIFDPTWDASSRVCVTEDKDGETYYEDYNSVDLDHTIVRELPSSIKYNYYMVPDYEFKKYFPKESIKDIINYSKYANVEHDNNQMSITQLDSEGPKYSEVINILPEVLKVTKKIEGYSDEEIDKYIDDAVDLMINFRFIPTNSSSPKY